MLGAWVGFPLVGPRKCTVRLRGVPFLPAFGAQGAPHDAAARALQVYYINEEAFAKVA